MAYIIAQPCIGTKDRACVEVCPVECFYEGEDQLYIHPDECINCAACEPVCPVSAIFEESATPEEWKFFIQKNKDFFIEHPGAQRALTKTDVATGKTVTAFPAPHSTGSPASTVPSATKQEKTTPPLAAPRPAAQVAPASVPTLSGSASEAALVQLAQAAAEAAAAAARAAEAVATAARSLLGPGQRSSSPPLPPSPPAQSPSRKEEATPQANPPQTEGTHARTDMTTPPSPSQLAPSVTATDLEGYRRAKDLLFHLVEITAGSREYREEVIQEAEALARSLREEVSQQVGRSRFTIMDLEKKGIVSRQKYDMARALADGVQRASLVKRWTFQKRTLVEYLVGGATTMAVSGLVGFLSWRAVLDTVLLPATALRLPDLLTAPLNPEGLPVALAAGAIVSLLGLFGLYALTQAFLLRRQLLLAQRDVGQKRPVQTPLAT